MYITITNMQSERDIEGEFKLWYKHLCATNPTHRSVARGWFMAAMGGIVAQQLPIATAKWEVRDVDEYARDKQEIAECHRRLRIAWEREREWQRILQETAATTAAAEAVAAKNLLLEEKIRQLNECLDLRVPLD